MESLHEQMYTHHHHHNAIKTQQTLAYQSGFPILAIAVLCIMATAFLLVTYYFFATRGCFHWQHLNPLRRFSMPHPRTDDPLSSSAYSTPPWHARGLDQLLIRDLPICHYTPASTLHRCVVCLNEFRELDTLRVLPSCSHAFHLDCIDIWLQNNSNCPLCRLSISGPARVPTDQIIAPTSSPQDGTHDFVVIELGGGDGNGPGKTRKFHPFSIMGDEGIDVRGKDDGFSVEPIRRSFSMDSAIDRHTYLSVQEVVRQNGGVRETRDDQGSSTSGRTRQQFFSFGHVRGSRSAVLPIEF